MKATELLHNLGQSLWLDNITRDLLNLGREARMNVPGRADGNWRWRVSEEILSPPSFQWLYDLTKSSKRLAITSSEIPLAMEATR